MPPAKPDKEVVLRYPSGHSRILDLEAFSKMHAPKGLKPEQFLSKLASGQMATHWVPVKDEERLVNLMNVQEVLLKKAAR